MLGHEIHAELGEIVTGKKPGRENDKEITIFDSTGTAFEDLMVSEEVINLAKKYKIGEEKEFILVPKNPYNPYSKLKF